MRSTLRPRCHAAFLIFPLLALALANCSNTTGGSPQSSAMAAQASAPGLADRMRGLVLSPAAQPGEGQTDPQDVYCPPVDVRQGASTITVYGAGGQSATNVRYQATVAQLARECAVLGATMTIKIGLQGRIILGPVGGPGRLDVPIRFALVQEGPQPKTIWTKLYRVPVDIPAGQTHVDFVHVEDNVTFPKPDSLELEAYVIYSGFDQLGARDPPRSRSPRDRGRS
ncbi:MAG TPA: hypothetical protein VHG27_01980 [Xanthobacteraceae bacterium]|nr:hypothetical protein [Xanthobacteraceae bacterium]